MNTTRDKNENKRKRLNLEQACFDRLREIEPPVKKINRQAVAELSNIPYKTLLDILNGNRGPSPSTKDKLCEYLGIGRNELEDLLVTDIVTSTISNSGDKLVTSDLFNDPGIVEEASPVGGFRRITAVIRRYNFAFLFSVLFIAIILAGWFLSNTTKIETELSLEESTKSCLIDFTVNVVPFKSCAFVGNFNVVGPNMGLWNGEVSAIRVPENWVVYARYEYWVPPNYDHIAEDGHGYVKLSSGLNYFDSMTYDLYEDFEQEKHVKVTSPNEMNDRIQFLLITEATSESNLVVHAHNELDNPQRLTVSYAR